MLYYINVKQKRSVLIILAKLLPVLICVVGTVIYTVDISEIEH